MRVATDDGHARQRCALLGADNVHDALIDIIHIKFTHTEVLAIIVQSLDLNAGDFIADAGNTRLALGSSGRDIVIGGGDISVEAPRFSTG